MSLSVTGLTKAFEGHQVLDAVSLEVPDGCLTVVVGASGSGKSTLLRVVAGLEAPDAGTVVVDGREVTSMPPASRDVGMVFQDGGLFPHLTVAANIGFGLRVRRVAKAEVDRRVREAAELAGADDLLSRRPQQLSGGERQRVALARALVRRPSVFLLDEPLSSLDASVRVTMRAEIRRVQQETGRSMLHVTHDQVEALTLGDRVAVLGHDGRIAQEGTPDEVFLTPANLTVATFLGSPEMNVLPASVSQAEPDVMRAGPFRVPALGDNAMLAEDLVVGVRPEDVAIARPGAGAAPATGVVRSVESAGSEAFVRVGIEEVELTVRVPTQERPKAGAAVSIAREPRRWHLFRASDGERVGPS